MENKTNKGAKDKLHDELRASQDIDNLAFNEEKQSFEYDTESTDDTYRHPLDYDTVSTGAVNDDSSYDEANPYVGDEYDDNNALIHDELEENAMHIDETGESVNLNMEDKILGRTDEDLRDDLDEEGYPKKDTP
ncbi:hypothetical protein [Pedobacter sp.]|uniref:hypothetical protein n=1 Tax=Pedobacter sp. TaxID=1411316 RepID=UPI00396C41E7